MPLVYVYNIYHFSLSLTFAKEIIDPKASEQVLELIVKIAEHPAIWKQIHRVLGIRRFHCFVNEYCFNIE